MGKIGRKDASVAEPKNARSTVGRKRDDSLDPRILDAALEVLAEEGFDKMTMDMVATRAGSGKASVYRRWSSKSALVHDALIRMNENLLVLPLPDTGNLRGDLLAVLKTPSRESVEQKYRVLAGLGSFFLQHQEFRGSSLDGVFGPIISAYRALMERARDRNELAANADIELACRIINAMPYYRRTIENKPFSRKAYIALIDRIILPALLQGPVA
ncbi:MAG: TetR/AcrR family transcriptional regulator [Leptospiraceae bacterium]|nr:TetR/AcrR family transcriptional regulator [Leptospiraceae bacterium]